MPQEIRFDALYGNMGEVSRTHIYVDEPSPSIMSQIFDWVDFILEYGMDLLDFFDMLLEFMNFFQN